MKLLAVKICRGLLPSRTAFYLVQVPPKTKVTVHQTVYLYGLAKPDLHLIPYVLSSQYYLALTHLVPS